MPVIIREMDDEEAILHMVDNNVQITTYQEPLLQEIQLYGLESELEQCVEVQAFEGGLHGVCFINVSL